MKIQIVGCEKSQKCSSTVLFLELFSGNLHDIPEELCSVYIEIFTIDIHISKDNGLFRRNRT